jgi:hypothetical protein
MKRILLPFVSLLTALALPSCLQQATTIHLNKDGSGTIVEETTFGAQMTAMLAGLGGLGGEDAKDPLKELVSVDKAKARAAKLGEGVTVEKTEAIDANGSKGARVTYHFADINKLKFTASGGLQDAMPAMPGNPVPDKPVESPTTFKYADGTLTIVRPDQEKPAATGTDGEGGLPPEVADLQGEQMEAMMKQMLNDMKISLKLVIEPGIAETTATHVDDNTITLMEMDMGKVMKNPDAFKKLKGIDQSNPDQAMEALKGFDGIKVEAKKEVTVKVK